MRSLAFLLSALLAGAALAGCTMPGSDDDTPTPTPATTTPADATPSPIFPTPTSTSPATPVTPTTPTGSTLNATTYSVTLGALATQAKPGQKVNVTVNLTGGEPRAADQVGAYFAATQPNATFAPNASTMTACEVANATLPTSRVVNCTFPAAGLYAVLGHARVTDNATSFEYWSASSTIVVRNYTLNLTDAPASARPATNFTVHLNVTGFDNVTSDHIGVHWFNDTTGEPTTETAAGACSHVNAGVIGNHTITCSISLPPLTATKDYYLRGHVRVTDGATVLSWWGDAHKVSVTPVGLGGLPG